MKMRTSSGKNRVLALLMTLAMVLSLLPVAASAEEASDHAGNVSVYTTSSDAEAVESNISLAYALTYDAAYIKLEQDTSSDAVSVDKTVTIDLGTYTLTCDTITIGTDGNLTITGTTAGKVAGTIANNGTLIVDCGTVETVTGTAATVHDEGRITNDNTTATEPTEPTEPTTPDNENAAEVVEDAPSVIEKDESLSEEKAAIAETVVSALNASETNVVDTSNDAIQAAIADAANSNTVTTAQATSALESAGITVSGSDTVRVVVQAYVSVQIKDVGLDENNGLGSLKVDIKPMIKTLATIAAVGDPIDTESESKNAAPVGDDQELKVTEPVEVSVPLPASFSTYKTGKDADHYAVNIKHTTSANKVYVYAGQIAKDSFVLTFTNPHGFSEFEIGVDDAVAYIGDIGYVSLQDAVDEVEDNGTINVYADNSDTVTVSRAVTFTVLGGNTTGIKAGSGYTVTPTAVDGGTKYVFAVRSSSSSGGGGGGSSSTTTATTTTTTSTNAQGVSATVTSDANGNVTAVSVTVPAAAATEAAANGTVLSIPVDNLSAPTSTASAPAISVSIPAEAGTVKIEIPVTNVSAGVVAVLVNADGTEQIVKRSTISANGVVLPVSGDVTLKVVDNTKSFGDIESGYWGGEAVTFVTARGIFDGTGSATFSPNVPMGRGMLAQVLYSLAGKPSVGTADFKDVSSSAWYANAVAWAAEQGIVSGYPDGSFGADDSISREQLALMLWNYAGKPAATQTELNFADAANASSWAQSALLWANEQGIINGKSDTALDPGGIATRAEVAQMIMKYLSNG